MTCCVTKRRRVLNFDSKREAKLYKHNNVTNKYIFCDRYVQTNICALQYLDGIQNFYRYSKTGTVVMKQVSHSNIFDLSCQRLADKYVPYFIWLYPLMYEYVYISTD